MATDRLARLVHDPPFASGKAVALEEVTVVAPAQEARFLAFRATGDRESGTLGLGPGLLLRLPTEREPEPVQMPWVETGEHVRLILDRIGGAGQELAPAVFDDPRVVAGCEPRSSGAAREREQLRKAETPVAARTGIRRLAPRVPLDERTDDCKAEGFTCVERDVRDAACVTRLARGDHRLGRAAGTLR